MPLRTFISINLTEEIKKKISGVQRDLRSSILEMNDRYDESLKWEKENNFHMTLFFIAEINQTKINEIESELSVLNRNLTFNEINLTSNSVNAFPNFRYPRVLIINLVNSDGSLSILSEGLNSVMKKSGFVNDKKFIPHITLARVKRDRKINLTEIRDKIKFEFKFKAEGFYLMKSELSRNGSEYSVLKEFKFQR